MQTSFAPPFPQQSTSSSTPSLPTRSTYRPAKKTSPLFPLTKNGRSTAPSTFPRQPTVISSTSTAQTYAVIADVPFWWTTNIAADLNIPRITWHAVGVFPQVVMNSLYNQRSEVIDKVNDNEMAVIKDLPDPVIKMPVSELPEFVRSSDNFFINVWQNMKRAQLESYGVVVNTFYEIEPTYCDHYKATDCQRAWFVGPVALARSVCNIKEEAEEKQRHECLDWLDGQKEGSVVVPAETIAEAVRLFMDAEGSKGRRRTATRKYACRKRKECRWGGRFLVERSPKSN